MHILELFPTTRKPFNQEDVDTFIDVSVATDEEYDILQSLDEVYISNEDFAENGFFTDMGTSSQYYILNLNDEELFFVDNQGHDYARYVSRLKGVDVVRA